RPHAPPHGNGTPIHSRRSRVMLELPQGGTVKSSIVSILLLSSALSYAGSPQAETPQTPPQPSTPASRPVAPAATQYQPQVLPDARRMEYELNTLRSMLYEMKSDLSNVKDPAARSALLVDSQMWEWL